MITIGDKVKVIKCIDDAVPIKSEYIGKIGIVDRIDFDRPAPISVKFEGINQDAFWPEELEIINREDFFDCGIATCAYYDTCETQNDRDDNKCDITPVSYVKPKPEGLNK